jgi:hypothetical protein
VPEAEPCPVGEAGPERVYVMDVDKEGRVTTQLKTMRVDVKEPRMTVEDFDRMLRRWLT